MENNETILQTKNLSFYYGANKALDSVDIDIKKNTVTAIIGPSGCGKSTLLRTFNRMNDFVMGHKVEGTVLLRGEDIYARKVDPAEIRTKIGMVFQRPNPFPKSIYQNIVWGPKIHDFKDDLDELVETSLKRTALWDEVKDRLHDSALSLSGGQQQRLCIARTIAMKPEVILMDEPCSALDPLSTSRIEALMMELKNAYTIITVTHNMQQAARISDNTLFMYEGLLVESGQTVNIFSKPKEKRTEDYITGRFG